MRKKIAVTGGIGSGKSLALQFIAELGYPIYSCDEIYKNIITSEAYVRQIHSAFPECIVEEKIDRTRLSAIVFENEENLKRLNAISHPLIMQELFAKMDKEEGLVFAEVPLLFEGEFEGLFDCVIVIHRNLDDRITATMKRDGLEEEAIKKRIQTQFDYNSEEGVARMKKCNACLIKNNHSQNVLKNNLEKVIERIKKEGL